MQNLNGVAVDDVGLASDVRFTPESRQLGIFMHMDATVDISRFKVIKAMFPETAGTYADPQ